MYSLPSNRAAAHPELETGLLRNLDIVLIHTIEEERQDADVQKKHIEPVSD